MKQLLTYILICVLTIFVGCRQQSACDTILSEVNSIIEQDPDSAYTILQTISDEIGNEADRANYTLLTAQAAYKLYKKTPEDSILHQTVKYYEHTGDRQQQCKAIYYRAMPLYEQGKHEKALLLLKEGEELATELKDNIYMAKYHESLCMVNDYAGYNDMMLKYAKLFLGDAIQLKDTSLIVSGLNHVSTAFTRLNQHEQAKKYIMKALPLLKHLNQIERAYILTNIGCTFFKVSDLESAKYYLKQSLAIYPKYNTYAELGNVYAEEGVFQDAKICWQKALASKNPTIVQNTLISMQDFYKSKKDYREALSISEKIYHLKDSISRISEQEKIAEIQHRYDRQIMENKYYKTLVWMLTIIIVSIIIVITILYFYRRSVKTYTSRLDESYQALLQKRQQIGQLEAEKQQQLKMLRNEKHQQVEKIEIINEKYNKKISELKHKADSIHDEIYNHVGRGKDVYDNILENRPILYKEDENSLIEYYNVFHYIAFQSFNNEYKNLSTRQIVFLILLQLGKTDAEICLILHIEKSSVRSKKSRLNHQKQETLSSPSVANGV